MVLSKDTVHRIANEWIEAWNQHDLERVLKLYTEDFSMSSPFIPLIAGDPSGTLHGKDNVRKYWRACLDRFTDLHFNLLYVMSGIDTIVIIYDSVSKGKKVSEVLHINNDGLIYKASGNYPD